MYPPLPTCAGDLLQCGGSNVWAYWRVLTRQANHVLTNCRVKHWARWCLVFLRSVVEKMCNYCICRVDFVSAREETLNSVGDLEPCSTRVLRIMIAAEKLKTTNIVQIARAHECFVLAPFPFKRWFEVSRERPRRERRKFGDFYLFKPVKCVVWRSWMPQIPSKFIDSLMLNP